MPSNEVILWMEGCDPGRMAADRVILCTINEFALMNFRHPLPDEFHDIITRSGSAGIVKI